MVLPTITATATLISSCDPDNGSITASVDIDDVADYTFMWYNGASIKPAPDYAETSSMLSDLSAGTYTVAAFHNSKRCNTQNAVTVTVMPDPATLITIDNDVARMIIPADCTDGNGQLGVTASSPGNTSVLHSIGALEILILD